MKSAELIFGFNSTYVNENSPGITLPCDLDWKMQVTGLTIDNTIISSTPAGVLFDLQTSFTTLPESYFHSLFAYLSDNSSLIGCQLNSDLKFFVCFYISDLQDLRLLTFTLENGIQFPLSPIWIRICFVCRLHHFGPDYHSYNVFSG